jgi:antitoxin FitA
MKETRSDARRKAASDASVSELFTRWRGVCSMATVTIPLSDERMDELKARAAQTGLTPEEFLRQCVEQIPEAPDQEFSEAAAQVLQKNAELYRRLA